MMMSSFSPLPRNRRARRGGTNLIFFSSFGAGNLTLHFSPFPNPGSLFSILAQSEFAGRVSRLLRLRLSSLQKLNTWREGCTDGVTANAGIGKKTNACCCDLCLSLLLHGRFCSAPHRSSAARLPNAHLHGGMQKCVFAGQLKNSWGVPGPSSVA